METTNSKERIKKVIRYAVQKGVATSQKDFGRVLGYTNESAFSQSLNKVPLSNSLLGKIKEALPDIDLQWLISGEGEMLTVANGSVSAPVQVGVDINATSTIDKALDEIAAQRRMTEALQGKLFELIDKITDKM